MAGLATRTCWRSIPLERGILWCPHSAPECLPNSTTGCGTLQGWCRAGWAVGCSSMGPWVPWGVLVTVASLWQVAGGSSNCCWPHFGGGRGGPSRCPAIRVLVKLLNLETVKRRDCQPGVGACLPLLGWIGTIGAQAARLSDHLVDLGGVHQGSQSPCAVPRLPECPFPPLPLIRMSRVCVPSFDAI